MTEHPAGHLLDELASGAGDGATKEHVAECGACAAYVEKLKAAAKAFGESADGDADAFMAKVAQRARETPKSRSGTRLARIAWIAAPLAAAAILIFVLRPQGAVDRPAASGERFKGALPLLAAIVEHDGAQKRSTTEVHLHAGDRLRAEVSVDRTTPIVAGVLEADGGWTALLASAELDAGTHFSEQAARWDTTPSAGWIVAGAPDAVARARTTHDFSDVAVVPIVPDP